MGTITNEADISSWQTRLSSGFHALRVRNYRLFWSGQLVSLTGSWMQFTAQAWLVLMLSPSPFAVGLVAALQWLPVTFLSLLGGVIVDRLPRHRLLILTQTAAMVIAFVFGMLVLLDAIKIWHIYLIAVIQGLTNAVDLPLRQSFAVELVRREHRTNVVALNSMSFNITRILGPALAGILIQPVGIAPILFMNAASFLAVIFALLRMDTSAFFNESGNTEGSVVQRLGEGLAYALRTSDVMIVLIVIAAIGTFGYNFGVTLPLIARFVLETDAAGFGALCSFMGVGSLTASITAAYTRNITTRRLLVSSTAFSIAIGSLAFSTAFAVSSVLLVALGFFAVLSATTANSLIHLSVPDVLRGRISSLYLLLFMGGTPVGGLLIGISAETFGVPTTLLLCSLVTLLGVIFACLYRWRQT